MRLPAETVARSQQAKSLGKPYGTGPRRSSPHERAKLIKKKTAKKISDTIVYAPQNSLPAETFLSIIGQVGFLRYRGLGTEKSHGRCPPPKNPAKARKRIKQKSGVRDDGSQTQQHDI